MKKESLLLQIKEWRKEEKKIALCHGCFDPLHIGHLHYFKEARKKADILIVSITADEYINKGNGHPFFCENDRVDMITALRIVDACYISREPTGLGAINLLKPDFYIKGIDYKNSQDVAFLDEKKLVESFGGVVYFTETKKYSSTDLIAANVYMQNPDYSIRKYFDEDFEGVIETIKSFSVEHGKLAYKEFPKYVKQRGSCFYVCLYDDKIVAVLGYRKDNRNEVEDIYWAEWGYVHQNHQRRGIATALWNLIEQDLRSKGCRKLYIDVGNEKDHINAIRFYRKMGYMQEGFCPDFWRDGEDFLIFAKRLNP